ncbi:MULTISPECIES: deoxyguanosinetriphosphate triphosphohydrolase family protein [Actinoalloteichus]|uniref:Deoxyguanosinetriphosphate triphosphohydrolase, putative n=1 Tax=Actinoalloteichus fjordicus TaxID=1612552 RepID=A0AAC9LE22_9PSEU|nr:MULTISPECIES: dNTP triphosphohydrolase [Actinoalloteichus]APU14579.1 deoxyguanosinetriphosphate triphosphohydrolase, putative [Actinoalloteichus fjordicus]APU20547.1 deoxyguanosinetriphosphate triphosphohydrolase, putative [Actinoalloteichus sp. GBA129-24]
MLRASRRSGAVRTPSDLSALPFRVDRDRVAASPFFSRLGGVTQVVSPTGSGLLLHNRLTHSLKVAQIARGIAERLRTDPAAARLVEKLGGLDVDVVEAASLAHDLGHPPFGHLGEQVLDRLARNRFGLADGFEGNAQSFRIITTTDPGGPPVAAVSATGLDLTAAVRASVLKYPWTRLSRPRPHPRSMTVPPRGATEPADFPGTGSAKFSVYVTELDDLAQARAPFLGRIPDWQQTVEAAVMDTADDIAYAIHDLDDFHRVGVLQHATVWAELHGWRSRSIALGALSDADLAARARQPGHALEGLRRRLHLKDSWIVDDDAFDAAVSRVEREVVDSLLAVPFDGSNEAEQTVARFSTSWTSRLVAGVRVVAEPTTRSAHIVLAPQQWHDVQVLKFIHRHFVLLRPDLALHQRGQARLLTTLVEALEQWLTDRMEAARLPRRLHDLVELADQEYQALASTEPTLLAGPTGEVPAGRDAVHALARGRAVVDFVASLSDRQAVALMDALSGRSGQTWADAFVL